MSGETHWSNRRLVSVHTQTHTCFSSLSLFVLFRGCTPASLYDCIAICKRESMCRTGLHCIRIRMRWRARWSTDSLGGSARRQVESSIALGATCERGTADAEETDMGDRDSGGGILQNSPPIGVGVGAVARKWRPASADHAPSHHERRALALPGACSVSFGL